MNRMQKMAWFLVITISTAILASAATVTVLYFKVGFPRAWSGLGALGIVGIGGLAPLFFRKDSRAVIFDERDSLIQRRAALTGFALAYMLMGLTCMVPFIVLGPKATVSIAWLPSIFGLAGISHYLSYSVAILVQYGRGSKDGKE